jgi:hypothetical protein
MCELFDEIDYGDLVPYYTLDLRIDENKVYQLGVTKI